MERVPGARGAAEADAFAALLLELKDRSGLSYGALAKRLHLSTSTLHRYCNGTALPAEFAPGERIARLCRATPQELMELHRRWILADAARRSRPDQAAAAGPGRAEASGAGAPDPRADGLAAEASAMAEAAPVAATRAHGPGVEPVVVDVPPASAPSRRRRGALLAAVAVAALLGAVVFAVRWPSGDGAHTARGQGAAGATDVASAPAPGRAHAPSATDSPGPSPSRESREPSAPASTGGPGRAEPGATKGGGGQGAAGPTRGGAAVSLNVAVRPYVYDSPCSQHFLVDSAPEQVGPPANEQDAPRWAAAYGAVSSGEQRVALTVQGTGRNTVVLEALHVRVVAKGAPLAWNDYAMGVGCGGGVDSKSFDIDLDDGSPTVGVRNGQRDFPYKVSESDPEVFYLTARTEAHDVRWDLSLDWSSGGRRGTVHLDNDGTPFRTSAGLGRPGYDYPLGGGEWTPREG